VELEARGARQGRRRERRAHVTGRSLRAALLWRGRQAACLRASQPSRARNGARQPKAAPSTGSRQRLSPHSHHPFRPKAADTRPCRPSHACVGTGGLGEWEGPRPPPPSLPCPLRRPHLASRGRAFSSCCAEAQAKSSSWSRPLWAEWSALPETSLVSLSSSLSFLREAKHAPSPKTPAGSRLRRREHFSCVRTPSSRIGRAQSRLLWREDEEGRVETASTACSLLLGGGERAGVVVWGSGESRSLSPFGDAEEDATSVRPR